MRSWFFSSGGRRGAGGSTLTIPTDGRHSVDCPAGSAPRLSPSCLSFGGGRRGADSSTLTIPTDGRHSVDCPAGSVPRLSPSCRRVMEVALLRGLDVECLLLDDERGQDERCARLLDLCRRELRWMESGRLSGRREPERWR